MSSISALIHTFNDERRLGRTLETLHPCDEIVIVDHASSDNTSKVAREYGAKVIPAVSGVQDGAYATDCKHDWVLCLLPTETLTEVLEASLFEWKSNSNSSEEAPGYAVRIRPANQNGLPLTSELRLVNRKKLNWLGMIPELIPDLPVLHGDLLRFESSED
jgi:glycosyltransferase involved in cell wall biosynthesis